MKLAVLKERRSGEARVAATPESVKKLKALGIDILVESGAGAGARISDNDFEAAGAVVTPDAGQMLAEADIVLSVRGPGEAEIAAMKKGAVLACLLAPHTEKDAIAKLAGKGVTAFAMEFVPRISRAQAMDVLSSQANLAGYKAVIDAAATFGRAMPMMMTAAGTIAPARVFIMGVGVAGLQSLEGGVEILGGQVDAGVRALGHHLGDGAALVVGDAGVGGRRRWAAARARRGGGGSRRRRRASGGRRCRSSRASFSRTRRMGPTTTCEKRCGNF